MLINQYLNKYLQPNYILSLNCFTLGVLPLILQGFPFHSNKLATLALAKFHPAFLKTINLGR